MDLRNKIKNAIGEKMSKATHIEKSKDIATLNSMVQETVKLGKSDVYEILDEVFKTEGDLEEIRLNPFGSNIKDIEKASEKFIKVLGKKFPKLRVKHVERLIKLFDRVESEIRLAKNKLNTDKVDDHRDEVLSKVKGDIEEMTGAASAGGFLGPLFTMPISRKMPVSTKKKNKKEYEVKEEKGFSPWLVSKDNPKGETDGLTPEVLQRIFSKIVNGFEEDEKDGQDTHNEEPIKKIEAKEATLSSSSGSYETPFFLAKNSKNWRGAAKTLYKGGKFVKVKDKCKTFPYCNQGDIKALELFEDGKYSKLADKVAEKMGENPLKVKSIILNSIEESLFQERMKQVNDKKVENSEKNNKIRKK